MNKLNRGESPSIELVGLKAPLHSIERSRLRYPIQCVPPRSKSVPPAAAVDEQDESVDLSDDPTSAGWRTELPVPDVIVPRSSDHHQQQLNHHLLSLYFKSLKLEQLLLLQKGNERVWNEHRFPQPYWYELRNNQFSRECHLNNRCIDNDDGEAPPREELLRVLHERKQIKRLLAAYTLMLD